VGESFKDFQSEDKVLLQEELEKARKAAEDAGFDPEASPKVQELKAKMDGALNLGREEGEVYDALITFFNRYYDEGDFISRRVYKDGTYAIPYNGEEVVMHWANKDQYYIKSSETLRDYSFRLDPDNEANPMRVHFRLVDAEAGAKDNNKEADESKRVFVLDADQPWEEVAREQGPEMHLRFHYRAATTGDWTPGAKKGATAAAAKKPPTHDHLRQIATERLLGEGSDLPDRWKMPLARPYLKVDGKPADYPVLEGHLNRYTKKNTFDYFIHKDLGGFLTRELDFYIKNELLRWEDVAALKTHPGRLAPLLSKIEVIRSIGEKIIAFLAQLEDFQKKLWLKKKFVTEVNYCITLDRLEGNEELLEEVLRNDAQLVEWSNLYALDLDKLKEEQAVLSINDFLAKPEYRYLMLDTGFLSDSLRSRILASIESLDSQCNGVLVQSENFQATSFSLNRFRDKVDCVYIDPPYNTSEETFLYKNQYRHSSWLSMILNVSTNSRALMSSWGVHFSAIDDEEMSRLKNLMDDVFPDGFIGTLAIQSNPRGRGINSYYATSHEYCIVHAKYPASVQIADQPLTDDQTEAYRNKDENGAYRLLPFRRSGGLSTPDERPNSEFVLFFGKESGRLLAVGGERVKPYPHEYETSVVFVRAGGKGDTVVMDYDSFRKHYEDSVVPVMPVDSDGGRRVWRWSDREKILDAGQVGDFVLSKNGSVQLKDRIKSGRKPKTLWFDSKYDASSHGTNLMQDILGERKGFSYPKSLYSTLDVIHSAVGDNESALVADFFAGSGTTAHAVIDLNRRDGGDRKYFLVEMGQYFDTVLKQRIQKVAYSVSWKDGKPKEVDGASHCFKYLRLESYEDALANLELSRGRAQQDLLTSQSEQDRDAREAYLLNYMLDVETRGSTSLLNVRQFVDPANYKLNVRNPTGDETKLVNVDLLETFNWLLGLTVEYIAKPIHFDATLEQGEFGRWEARVKRRNGGRWWFRTVAGTNRKGQKVLVVWRNLPSVIDGEKDGLVKDNSVLDAVLIDKLKVRLTESPDDEFDILYVNGDHNISIPKKRSGGLMEARVKLIEEDFHRLMFSSETH
jgi:adenine-specific DNA-methyltransferase